MKKIRIIGVTVCVLLAFSLNKVQSQTIYSGFPEKFDTESIKDSYETADVDLKTGTWRLKGVKLVDKKRGIEIDADGTKGLQFISNNKGPMVAEMKFDVTDGASKVTVLSSSYGTDATCKWRLQASTDGGKKWKYVGEEVLVDNKLARTEEFNVNIKGKVRFRILKVGLGSSKLDADIQNGRLVIDNIAIYKK